MEAPPKEADFSKSFVLDHCASVAARVLETDKELSRFRWDLVPSKITEVHFWRNYFYRVSLCVAAVAVVPTPKIAALPTDDDDDDDVAIAAVSPLASAALSPSVRADINGPFIMPPPKRDVAPIAVADDDELFVTDEAAY